MIAFDVNVLLAAHRLENPHHKSARRALVEALAEPDTVALPDLALSAVVRIATHRRASEVPSSFDEVFGFVGELLAAPNVVMVSAGADHWGIFERVCRAARAHGSLVTDAWLAAIAIEHDCEWVSFDHDFARFPGLRWREPE